MSEVKRYWLKEDGGLFGCAPAWEPKDDEMVMWPDFKRVQGERDALQLSLNAADQRIDELERDKARLDAIESNFWVVRYTSSPNGDAGDYSNGIEIVGYWMDKPVERVIGENYSENLRAAIDQAMEAPAYPPARPEYPELDELIEQDHQIPGTSGMRLNMLANQGE
ncbi:hypothetical protein [Pseudomonas frederiksbergensis]|uniref:hypothetical protein n=1 Tax=Pseudomonas frederiksbergensis TaxID=104087 RepID=UPI00223AEDCA|nr:hypothetical protein [Pseudomonas frederiksbergensis]